MPTSNFIDVATIWLHAGKGGDGAMSMRREALVEFGGPSHRLEESLMLGRSGR